SRRLDLGDQRRIVLFAGVHALIEHFLEAGGVEIAFGGIGKALAIGRLVVNDRHLLVLEVGQHIIGPKLALLVVAAAIAEHIPKPAFGNLRIGGRGRHHQDVVFGVNLGGGNRNAGIEVPDHQRHAVADELVGDRDALLGIGNVVADFDGDLLTIDAALGI